MPWALLQVTSTGVYGMSEKSLIAELSEIFKELVTHTKEQAGMLNQRMDALVDSVTQSNVEISTLAKIVARSEESRLNQKEGLERIGDDQKETSDKLNTYTSNNDDRVMDVEKQNIELKIQGDNVRDEIKVFKWFVLGTMSTVLGAALIAWIVIK